MSFFDDDIFKRNMGALQGRGLNALGQLGAGSSLQGLANSNFVRVSEQQMHAQQQMMDQMLVDAERRKLDAELRQIQAMGQGDLYVTDKGALERSEAFDYWLDKVNGGRKIKNPRTSAPDIDKVPIREYLQWHVNKWLEPVTI